MIYVFTQLEFKFEGDEAIHSGNSILNPVFKIDSRHTHTEITSFHSPEREGTIQIVRPPGQTPAQKNLTDATIRDRVSNIKIEPIADFYSHLTTVFAHGTNEVIKTFIVVESNEVSEDVRCIKSSLSHSNDIQFTFRLPLELLMASLRDFYGKN
jgi:hypothetical protein